MGELLRRFWTPVLLSAELPEADGTPKKIAGAAGWAKRSVPTTSVMIAEGWWARRKSAFAHPTAESVQLPR